MTVAGHTRPAQPGHALRVVSYNVHGQQDDEAALTEMIRSAGPDVLVMQEGPRRLRWRQRCADLADRTGLLYAAGGLPSLGNVVLTSQRVRVHDSRCVQFPLTPGRHLRGAVVVECSIGRTRFVVVGSHLATDPAERPGQAAVLVDVLAGVDQPVVIAADLNETSGGAAWRTLADGRLDAGGADGRPTYPAAQPRQRIDVIFVDPRFELRGCQVPDNPPARLASDHLPVVADLWLPSGEASG
jgi:endonuclease/exonuclease/phosphatase family metal-dependent hydrolase